VIAYRRVIRFEDVDAAQIVFFARYASMAHEAVEHFFGALAGGYPGLINDRRLGMPVVHLEADYHLSLRYGDSAIIETSCRRVGRTSAVLANDFRSASSGALCATVLLTVATASLVDVASCPMPDDVRALLTAHLSTPVPTC
jgi:YbgC/YbaW family acyl-CoA thioester hydrolase